MEPSEVAVAFDPLLLTRHAESVIRIHCKKLSLPTAYNHPSTE